MIPKVNIRSISRKKISDEHGMDRAVAVFTFDEPVVEYRANVLGVSPHTGFLAHQRDRTVETMKDMTVDQAARWPVDAMRFVQLAEDRTIEDLRSQTVDTVASWSVEKVVAKYEDVYLSAEIDWTELYQEGTNRVNIYGRTLKDTWTPYQGG